MVKINISKAGKISLFVVTFFLFTILIASIIVASATENNSNDEIELNISLDEINVSDNSSEDVVDVVEDIVVEEVVEDVVEEEVVEDVVEDALDLVLENIIETTGFFGCENVSQGSCDSNSNCTWEDFVSECFLNCFQYDYSDNSTCENSFGGGECLWDSAPLLCDPVSFNKSWEGFSFCFDYDGNKTGCDSFPNDCTWFTESQCGANEEGSDVSGGNNSGWCDPSNMNFREDYNCWSYDGNKTGCEDSKQNYGWTCEWHSDPWGALVDGTEAGWCNQIMGGGGSGGGGCWDYFNNDSCTSAASLGMPCTWKEQTSNGWCQEKGCWNYDGSQSSCEANSADGCVWNSDYNYCYRQGCWDLNSTECSSSSTYGLDCNWKNDTYSSSGGWCEENGCWQRDWTNQTYCEAQEGCNWDGNWCNNGGCWDYDSSGESTCNNNTLTGLNCEWETGSWGWCEQKGCWDYDGTNVTDCQNVSADLGLDCTWDAAFSICYENFNGCTDYDSDQFGCFGTGYCVWNPGNSTCIEPTITNTFFNPSCWIFDQAGENKCGNVTTCGWNMTGSEACEDNGVGANGIQCVDINNSELCNNIPMLSSCCKWTSSGCQDAAFSTSCWDNLQEPPEGADFCEDYNAKYSKSTCEQIAGDPWYMPCEWNNVTDQCGFAIDDLFGGNSTGFNFHDIGSKSNCESLGGEWNSEKWTDPNTGAIYTDEWCEMGFGIDYETCSSECWACEYPDNSSDPSWDSTDEARSACEQSVLENCIFIEDSNAFNDYGWCNVDWDKSGNCDDNCWECWDSDQCSDSLEGCKWFTDPYNDNSWCDDKNVKTCDDECYNCWDQNNCLNSEAECTWDTNYNFCKPSGSGDGTSSEICFDGIDNDGDDFIDCADSECTFNEFCGGSVVLGSNCLSIPTESACGGEADCVWITDQWNNTWCDMKGAQCWTFDDNETACDAEADCSFNTMQEMGHFEDNFCDVNFTLVDSSGCWNFGINSSVCNAQSANGCIWIEDQWCVENPTDQWCQNNLNAGWCDHEVWVCDNYYNETACSADLNCGWQADWFNSEFGWCDPICFSRNSTTCGEPVDGVSGVCELFNSTEMGWCEPTDMFRDCWDKFDESSCNVNNETCIWINDSFVPGGGFCEDKFMHFIPNPHISFCSLAPVVHSSTGSPQVVEFLEKHIGSHQPNSELNQSACQPQLRSALQAVSL